MITLSHTFKPRNKKSIGMIIPALRAGDMEFQEVPWDWVQGLWAKPMDFSLKWVPVRFA